MTTNPIANIQQQQLPPRVLPIQKVVIDLKLPERKPAPSEPANDTTTTAPAGHFTDSTPGVEKVEEVRPDYLIMTLQRSEERPSLCDLLWERFPRLKVLALQAESNDSILYWVTFNLSANRIETSEKGILDALRSGTVSHQPQEPELSPKVN